MSNPINNLLVIRSLDMERAVRFYEQIGVCFEKHAHGKGPEHYASAVCGFVFEIYPAHEENDATKNTRLGFNVDCVDSVVELLCKIDVEVISKPKESPWGRRAVVRDFDGHAVELLSPTKTQKFPES